MSNSITFNTTGLIAGTPLTGEDYYKLSAGTGVLATCGDSLTRIYLTVDSDNNPSTFNLRVDELDNSGNAINTATGIFTFLDTNISKSGPELWRANVKETTTLELAADTNHDGLADGFVFSESNQVVNVPLIWHPKNANNEVASFAAILKDDQNNDITFSGSIIDTDNDNQPDRFVGQGFETYDYRMSLIDSNGDGQKDHFQMYIDMTQTGRVQVDSSGNPAGLYTDNSLPFISSFSPSDGAINIAVDHNIVLTFSEAIQKGEGSIVIHSGSASGPLVERFDIATSGNLAISGNTLAINPTTDLVCSTHYYIGLSKGVVRDLSGNLSDFEHAAFTTTAPIMTPVMHNGVSLNPTVYSGPAKASGEEAIHFQFLGDTTNEVVQGTRYNDFINIAAGDDAVNAGAGNDVIDGGLGSNFLTGGAGTDIFFSDGRGGGITWSTITDWQAGEQLSVWGWVPGVSKIIMWREDGAAGYQGLTMHADLDGNGTIDTSVTFTGITSQSQLPTPGEFANPALLWFH
jgi:hypothetical protein